MAKDLSCSVCGKSFRTDNGLLWHLTNIHGAQAGEIGSHEESTLGKVQPDGSKQRILNPVEPDGPEMERFDRTTLGYPSPALPLVPSVLAGISEFNTRISDYFHRELQLGPYTLFSDLAPLVDLDMGNPLDRAELGRLLEEVNVEELAIGCPLLSSIVVHKSDNQPGNGFYNCAQGLGQLSSKKEMDEIAFWSEEVKKVFATPR